MENNNKSVDNSSQISDNVDNDVNVHVVKMDEQAPINDSNHEHRLVADPSDTIGEAVYHGCIIPRCGLGFYIREEAPTSI